jgi:hypothetical protein
VSAAAVTRPHRGMLIALSVALLWSLGFVIAANLVPAYESETVTS